jgi:hypothetical protein
VYVGSADLQLYCRSYLSQSPRYEGPCLWLTYNKNKTYDGMGRDVIQTTSTLIEMDPQWFSTVGD